MSGKELLVESLEQDYIVDQDFQISDTDGDEEEAVIGTGAETNQVSEEQQGCFDDSLEDLKPPLESQNGQDNGIGAVLRKDSPLKSKEKKKPKKSKGFTHLSFRDYGMDLVLDEFDLSRNETTNQDSSLIQPKWCQILDSIYDKHEKQLYVKSHTKVKVLIVCSSAIRCVNVIRSLKNGLHKNVQVAKLFAKHMKASDQIKVLKEGKFLVGVGTPARIVKIMQDDPDAMPLKKLDYLMIDSSFRDGKNMSILDLPDTGLDTKKLYELCSGAHDGFKVFSI